MLHRGYCYDIYAFTLALSEEDCLTCLLTLLVVLQEPSERPFDLAAVPKDVKPQLQVEKKAPTSREKKAAKDASQKAAADGGPLSTYEAYEKLLNSIPEFAGFGKLSKVVHVSYLWFENNRSCQSRRGYTLAVLFVADLVLVLVTGFFSLLFRKV